MPPQLSQVYVPVIFLISTFDFLTYLTVLGTSMSDLCPTYDLVHLATNDPPICMFCEVSNYQKIQLIHG